MTDLDEQSEEIRGRGKRQSGGATQSIQDPRVTTIGTFVMNVLQGLVVLALAFVANNLNSINLTLAADAVSKQEMARQLAEVRAKNEQQEEHINYVDRRVYTLEGRSLRGPAEPNHAR